MLQLIFVFILLTSANVILNGDFEKESSTGITNWENQYSTCEIDTTTFHSGKQSLHCKDNLSDKRGGIKQTITIQTGMPYKISAYVKLKNIQNGDVLIFSQSPDDAEGTWPYVGKTIEECKDGNCDDKWYYFETTTDGFQQATHIFGVLFHKADCIGEFWIDDIVMEPILPNILHTVQINAWRDEVFEDETIVNIGLNVESTIFENGNHLSFKLELINQETNTVSQTITEFKIIKELRQVISQMKFNPKSLKIGYYTLKVSCTINYLQTKTMTFEQTIRKRGDNKHKQFIYIDENKITWKDNKKWFPIGLYLDEMVEEDFHLLKDSVFNVIVSPGGATPKNIESLFSITNGQVYTIRPVTKGFCVESSCTNEQFEKGLETLKELINQFKDVNGFIGYYPIDEPLIDEIERIKKGIKIIRENDDKHIIYTAIHKNNQIPQLKDGFDVFGVDVYPVQNQEPLNTVWRVAEKGRKGVANAKGLWNIIQIFDHTFYGKENEQPPTEQQMRQMTYQTIAGGSMGIIYYDFTCVKKMDNKTSFEKQWTSIKKIAKELKDNYSEIIFSEEKPNSLIVMKEQENDIGSRIFRKNGIDYVLIVNNENEQHQYSFTIPNEQYEFVMMTGSSTMTKNKSTITLQMPAMDVVWLKTKESSNNDNNNNNNNSTNNDNNNNNSTNNNSTNNNDNNNNNNNEKSSTINKSIIFILLALIIII